MILWQFSNDKSTKVKYYFTPKKVEFFQGKDHYYFNVTIYNEQMPRLIFPCILVLLFN